MKPPGRIFFLPDTAENGRLSPFFPSVGNRSAPCGAITKPAVRDSFAAKRVTRKPPLSARSGPMRPAGRLPADSENRPAPADWERTGRKKHRGLSVPGPLPFARRPSWAGVSRDGARNADHGWSATGLPGLRKQTPALVVGGRGPGFRAGTRHGVSRDGARNADHGWSATGLLDLRKQTPALLVAGEGRGFERGHRGTETEKTSRRTGKTCAGS